MTYTPHQGALRLLDTCAAVTAGETVGLVTDPMSDSQLADTVASAAIGLGASITRVAVTLDQLAPDAPVEELPVAALSLDVLVGITSTSIYHSRLGRLAATKGARVLALTRCTSSNLVSGAIEADFAALEPTAKEIASRLGDANEILVTAPGGLQLTGNLEGRRGWANTGLARHAGIVMGCLDIEAFIAPLETSVEGTIVCDASTTPFGLVDQPITITISKGRAKTFTGGRHAKMLEQLVRSHGPSANVVAEFGFGLNPRARVVGNIIEDEATYGTGHVALGSNEFFSGANSAPCHIDLVYWKPTLLLDRHTVMHEGELTQVPS